MKKVYCILFSAIILLTSSFFALSVTATMGDVNSDNKVNSTDALIILKYSVGLEILSNFDYDTADLNNDDIINSTDALVVLKISVGLLETSTITREDTTTKEPVSTTVTEPTVTTTTEKSTTIPNSENYHGHVYTGGDSSTKYHYEAECAGKYSHEITWDEVSIRGLGPCKTCVLK